MATTQDPGEKQWWIRRGKGITECWKDSKEAVGISLVGDEREHRILIFEKHTCK